MSNIKLVSKEYTSKFVTGPELNLKLDEKQDTLKWYQESGTSPYKADMASNEVTLRAGGDTDGIIHENAKISLSQEDGQISIESNYGFGDLQNILSTSINGGPNAIHIGEGDSSVYVNGPLYCKGTLFDKDGGEITGGGGGSKWVTDRTDNYKDILYLGKDKNDQEVNSIFVCGPMYNKDLGSSIEFIGDESNGGILMNVSSSGADTGLILENKDTSTRLTLSPYLCSYYEGPCIGQDGSNFGSLALVGGNGAAVKIVVRNDSGSEKSALINYDNIDKLINLLNS